MVRGHHPRRSVMFLVGLLGIVLPAQAAELAGGNREPVGGGTTRAGMSGAYFANPACEGTPAFTRRDVRIDFDWKEGVAGRGLPVGGSTTPGMRDFPLDGFSVRWTGQVVPRFAETYTWRITGRDGARFRIRPQGAATWTTLVDSLAAGVAAEAASAPFQAGATYDIVFEYVDRPGTGASVARMEWSSPSTPWEVVEPLSVAQICGHQAAPDAYLSGDRADLVREESTWTALVDGDWKKGKALAATEADAGGWPTVGRFVVQLNRQNTGRHLVRFAGKANVEVGSYWHGAAAKVGWRTAADGSGAPLTAATSKGGRGLAQLPKGTGFAEKDGMTTAWFDLDELPSGLMLIFTDAERIDGQPGIASLSVLGPVSAGSTETHQPGEIRRREARTVFDNFVIDRLHIGMSQNKGSAWSERTLPAYRSREHQAGWGYCLEEYIMMVNANGMDWHICFGAGWDDDYMRKFARLIRYGSDGVEPYDRFVENPVYPPLNPNLRVYLEHSNELPWAVFPGFIWEDLKKKARENHPDWQIISYDGKVKHDGTGNGYGYHGMYRYHALRMKRMSDAFRTVYADEPAAMGGRARVLCMGRYDAPEMNTMLQFLDNYFNNGDGRTNVADPHPPGYFLWGGGGAIYYGCGNRFGLTETETLADSGFEKTEVPAGTAALRPAGAAWTFTGNAGVCDVQVQRQSAIGAPVLPAEPAPPLAKDHWVGVAFTVGAKDLYVYQLGRWVGAGNKDAHEVAIFDEAGGKVTGESIALDSKPRGAFAYAWCTVSSCGKERVMPAYLQAGKTYRLVSREKAGADADRYAGAAVPMTAGPGLTVLGAVSGPNGKEWQTVEGQVCGGPVDMICTDRILSTAEGVVGHPADASDFAQEFRLGEQCAFLTGASGMSQEFTVGKAGSHWITFTVGLDRPTNGFKRQGWGGWAVAQGGNSVRVLIDGVDQTPTPLPQGGWSYAMHATHYAATKAFRLEAGRHTVAFERVKPGNGTMYLDEIHLSSEEAFYGGPTAPNFPAGGSAFGQNAATGYHRTAKAECDMSRNWGLVPCTYEGGWAVQGDFDHYSMLAWNDLRYGSPATNSELTKQALRNAFGIWSKAGGRTYAYFYPIMRKIADVDAPLLRCVQELNDRLLAEADNGTPLPAVLSAEQDHYQSNVDDDYYGFNALKPKAGPLMKAGFWKAWGVIAPATADYDLRVEATPGGRIALDVDGVRVAAGDTPALGPVTLRLTKGAHNVRVRCVGGLVLLQRVTVCRAGEAPPAATGAAALAFPAKPADGVIDLRAACNRDLVDDDSPGGRRGWAAFDAASCIKDLAAGPTDFGYRLVRFDIVDRAANGGNACIVLSGPKRADAFPRASAAIPVGRKAAALYFLHTAMCVEAKPGEALVRYRIAYADGGEAVFDCRNREELGDWWGLPNLPGGMAVHSERSRCLMMTPWKNPNPDRVIASITMESTGKAVPILLGITAAEDLAAYEILAQILK